MTMLNWTELGVELRAAARDAGFAPVPTVFLAYSFLLENPECFGRESWPDDMPAEPNIELIAAYYGRTN
jgi:hypothetical protein